MLHIALAATEVADLHPADANISATAPTMNLDQLYRHHHHHLLRFVQRYVRNSEDAEDVVQNTFMEALRCAQRFLGLSKPSTWLYGIALNLARNQVRRNCSQIVELADQSFMDQVADAYSDPAHMAELREAAGRIAVLLSGLSSDIRTTFDAVLDGDSTYEQAAEQLQIPVGTVRSRVSRVRAAIRSQCI